ncbi:Lrp/AsnC family transcriptional regulator [Arthrobacter crystallopoietes]|uniref:Lrp/AsnC family transcriptional regulator n=1 Tax=Crystallibacter crystallopoietes TaxID=37928 RepID=UPI001ABE9259|nr:Lrp/AsnC family transcriptional regulator [Arthrobacter crystallopoietes]QTG81777.1 Lrp/AsnC family transcriptional regulator [Arthrobacter crystallopoietes]
MTERDLELVSALQVAPRASWEDLSRVLGVHPTTLARRWARLVEAGLARVSIAPGPELLRMMDVAFVELTCQNDRVQEVAETLIPDERLMSIQFIAGSAHLLLTVAAAGRSLSSFLLTTIGSLDGVLHYAVRTVTSQIIDASLWHFRALPASKIRRLSQLHQEAGKAGEGTPAVMDAPNRALMRALGIDGRTSLRELAATAGISALAAARRVSRLIGGKYVSVRCDVARRGSGRSYSAILWGSMRPDRFPSTDILDRVPALRVMTSVTGTNNIHIVVWLNNPMDLLDVEQQLLDAIGGLTIEDRRIVLRTFKFNGAKLNEDGTIAQIIPMAY